MNIYDISSEDIYAEVEFTPQDDQYIKMVSLDVKNIYQNTENDVAEVKEKPRKCVPILGSKHKFVCCAVITCLSVFLCLVYGFRFAIVPKLSKKHQHIVSDKGQTKTITGKGILI